MSTLHNDNSIYADTIGECWLKSIKTVMKNGNEFYDEDVKIKELLGLNIEINYPSIDDKIINKYRDKYVIDKMLKKFSKGVVMNDRPFTYGECIYNKNSINQFEWLLNCLTLKKETKSATIGLLTEGNNGANLPCLTTIDVKIRANKLTLQFFFRSQNIFGRQYANLLALAHIYDYDFDQANDICSDKEVCIKDKYYKSGPKLIRVL